MVPTVVPAAIPYLEILLENLEFSRVSAVKIADFPRK
jgi:hypothetical protein